MNLETIGTVVTMLGGVEMFRYIINLILNRKAEKRKSEAEVSSQEAKADGDEFHVLRETIEFLQAQLKEKEERFAEQTQLVRNLNAEILQITDSKNAEILRLVEENASLKLELQKYKCVVPRCLKRDPQNGY